MRASPDAPLEFRDPNFEKVYHEKIEKCLIGQRTETIWIDQLKDERRKAHKVKKPRLFTMGPLEHQMACKKFFGDFVDMLVDTRHSHGIAVGTDASGPEWSLLVNNLKKYSSHGLAGDYAEYDGTEFAGLMHECVTIVNDWYDDSDENKLARHTLCDEMLHATHLNGNFMYVSHCGMKSGWFLTAIFNSLMNMMYMAIAYLLLARNKVEGQTPAPTGHDNLLAYSSRTFWYYYGDDNCGAIDRKIEDWYNGNNLAKCFALHGITYTPADKSATFKPNEPIENLTFLKRGFRSAGTIGKWMSPIDTTTIQELTNWSRQNPDPDFLFENNLMDSLTFAFHHGEEYYTEHLKKINSALFETGYEPISLPFKSLFNDWIAKFH